ncbi:unnamed protein product [Phytophthora fragariaefolia]|uniref:Unnamed protein product n=1 Tax=Phytophthora fragariaefolia TaxID=1490495 RepID=A0A9W7D8Z5_9STRA|nr:unnamed protein product [Phytophthora fragariaefolia]
MKKVGCRMKIRLEAVDANNCGGPWRIVHLDGSLNYYHPPIRDPRVHSGHRRRDADSFGLLTTASDDIISAQLSSGITPGRVMATLRHANSSMLLTVKNIANSKDGYTSVAYTPWVNVHEVCMTHINKISTWY